MLVYLITHIEPDGSLGKQYVGQTVSSLQKRWTQHCSASKSKPEAMPILAAIAKYGKENFTVEEIGRAVTQEELDMLELKFATELNTFSPNGYNIHAGEGKGSLSPEAAAKIGKWDLVGGEKDRCYGWSLATEKQIMEFSSQGKNS